MAIVNWLKSCSLADFYQMILTVIIVSVTYLSVYGFPGAHLKEQSPSAVNMDDGPAQNLHVSGVMA